MHFLDYLLTGGGAVAVTKTYDYLIGLSKNKTDRTTSRETQADQVTKTALDALKVALDELRRDVEAEKGKRIDAEGTVETLRVAVDALASRIEEQNRELADQPKLKAENAKLRRQVSDLQKQVGELKSRIADLEQTRSECVQLASEILAAQDGTETS